MEAAFSSLQSLFDMRDRRNEWLKELREVEKRPRVLTTEDRPPRMPSEREQCIICDKRTTTWLQPENAPLCSMNCLDVYIQDPSVYDPRELHSRPSPRLVFENGKPVAAPSPIAEKPARPKSTRRRRKPGRWEPTEEEIAAMQARIRARHEGKDE